MLRTNAKDSAVKAVPGGYDLNGSDQKKITSHVKNLLNDDEYIFPFCNDVSNFTIFLFGDTRSNIHELQSTKHDVDNPFRHPVIVTVLREEFFQKANSFGKMNPKLFVSRHKTRNEPELPEPMVALIATAVCLFLYYSVLISHS